MQPTVVTRPQPDAGLWVQQLQAEGIPAVALPMMEIGPNQNPAAQQAVDAALSNLAQMHACMFVSSNAVRYFFAAMQRRGVTLPATMRLWSPGPGTTKALVAQGVALAHVDQPAADAAQFDSEALWQQVSSQLRFGQQVLIVRGGNGQHAEGNGQHAEGNGRQWLTQQLQAQGVQVHFASVYERKVPTLTNTLRQALVALQQQPAVWLFSSSECVQHLVQCNPSYTWQAHTALATHPRIAQQARQAGFGRVIETLPSVRCIAASIKSLHDPL